MLSKDDKMLLLKEARNAIEEVFVKNIDKPFKSMEERGGVFVTLTKNGDLRGCIGFLDFNENLIENTRLAAKSAAFNDSRFAPLSKNELKDVKIEISVLSKPYEIKEEYIVLGKHGLIIEKGNSTGLLLPQVATEHGFSKKEFLNTLCEKAGLPFNSWKESSTRLMGFEAEVFNESILNN